MKYYKLSMDMERGNDVICHYSNDFGIELSTFIIGKKYEGWNDSFEFFYNKQEGEILTDYLANDKGWFVVSEKLKEILNLLNTDIQFLPIRIVEKRSNEVIYGYSIANVLRIVDALCLEKSIYTELNSSRLGTVYSVARYGIFAEKTYGADVFKLANHQVVPLFVSENFKRQIEANKITGISLSEISVA